MLVSLRNEWVALDHMSFSLILITLICVDSHSRRQRSVGGLVLKAFHAGWPVPGFVDTLASHKGFRLEIPATYAKHYGA
jgi:hypothetical protein